MERSEEVSLSTEEVLGAPADHVTLKLSENLLVILAEYFPQDGTVVEATGEVLSMLRRELDLVLAGARNYEGRVPLNWSSDRTTEDHSSRLATSPWVYIFLKVHQILSQLVKIKPVKPTLTRTNGFETTSLVSALYQSGGRVGSSDPSSALHLDSSVYAARAGFEESRASHYSSDSSTLSSMPDPSRTAGEAPRDEIMPAVECQKSGASGARAPPVAADAAQNLVERVEAAAGKLWPSAGEIYIVLKPNVWAEHTTEPIVVTEEARAGTYLLMDEGHISMAVTSLGRFDAYLLASVCESVLPLIEKYDMLKLPHFLVEDERMVISRAHHSRRVYRDSVNTYLITQAKFDWYVALLTSGSIRAVQDTFVDFSQEIWHAQFNRGFNAESAERLEALMISLLGHQHDMVRSQSSVCLNNLIDRHDWQQEIPFLPIVKRIGDSYLISVVVGDSNERPDNVFIISMAPSPTTPDYVYTYHTLEWIADKSFPPRHDAPLLGFAANCSSGTRVWKGTCNLGKFSKCGFYDWRLVRADVSSGSWRAIHATLDALQKQCTGSYSLANLSSENDLEFKSRNLWPELGRLKEAKEATGHSHFRTLPIQGRFIVLPDYANYANLHEINIDLCGAVFKKSLVNADKTSATSDVLEERGSFAKVSERLDQLKAHGINTLCLTGCQARNNGRVSYGNNGELEFDDEDASPYAVTCRGSVCEVIGGRTRLNDLVKDSWRRGMRVLVEFQSRVSVCGAHRKYSNLTLACVDSQGHRKPLEGGQGKYFKIDESSELNYRCKKSWDLYIDDVLEWLNRCDGVRLDCAHLLPRIYEADDHELNRLDPDGLPHYTSLEKLVAPIVVPTNKDCGFWNSTAAASHWPNPFLLKVCKVAWQKHPTAVLIGDCGLLPGDEQKKIGSLCRSGLIPFVQSMPALLLRIFGLHVDEQDQSVQQVPPCSPAECVTEWYEKLHESLPEGGIVVQSSTTAQSAYPSLLYKRGAWPAADLLQLSTDIPCTTMGEDEGHCLRRGVANVSVRDEVPVHRVLSYAAPEEAGAVFARARSLARFEDPKDVEKLEQEYVKHFSPKSGQDIRQISAHYKHRREFRSRYKILSDTPMMPVRAYDAKGEALERLFTSCRIDAANNVAIIGTNFAEERCPHVEVNISFLNKVISARHPPSGSLVEAWNLFTVENGTYDPAVCNWKTLDARQLGYIRDEQVSLMSLSEFLAYPHTFSVEAYQSSGLGMKVLDKSHVEPDGQILLGLYLSALRRLCLLAAKAKAQRVSESGKRSSQFETRLKMALSSNYILQSLSTTIRRTDSVSDLALVLSHVARAGEWHRELCGEALPALSEVLTDVEFLSAENPMTATFFAKISKIAAGIDAMPTAGTGEAPLEANASVAALRATCRTLEALEAVTPIVFVTSELGKWSTVGGLGVMIDELSQTIATDIGYECIVMCPYYHVNRRGQTDYMKDDGITWKFNVEVAIGPTEKCVFGVHTGEVKNVKLIFLHNESIWHHPYPDNSPVDSVRMLVAFGKAFLETLCQLEILPQLIVTNDWATGLIPAYAKNGFFAETFSGTTFFHIVHNFDPAYEGRIYPPAGQDFTWLHELPRDALIDPLWATPILNPSRCVLLHCDQWGTVSPSYRDELRGSEASAGSSPLKYLLNRFPQPFAVCNGVPVKPRRERIAALPFKTHDEAKAELQRKYFGFSLPDLSIPLFSFIGRVTIQKGVHMILESAESIIQRYNNRVQILVGGPVTWKDPYSAKCGNMMLSLRAKYPWSFYSAPNEFFSDGTLVNLGSDFGLMPSLFEPGGIVQHEFFIAGTPVIAYNTGGLKDTVHEYNLEINQGNGFNFSSYNLGDYIYAIERAMRVFSDKDKYLKLRKNAEASVYTCEQCAREWCQEFCRLRNKILLNPKTVKQLAATLPVFSPDAIHQQAGMPSIATPTALQSPQARSPPATPVTSSGVVQFRLYHPRSSRTVAVTGSYDGWRSRRYLPWDNALGCFCLDMALQRGEHLFKFIVDGAWICSDFHKKKLDEEKIENNYIIIE